MVESSTRETGIYSNMKEINQQDTQHLLDTISTLTASNMQHMKEIRCLQETNKSYYSKLCRLQVSLIDTLNTSELLHQALSTMYTNLHLINNATDMYGCVSIIANTIKTLLNTKGIVIYFRSLGGQYSPTINLEDFLNTEYGDISHRDGRALLSHMFNLNNLGVTRCNSEQLKHLTTMNKYIYTSIILVEHDPVYGVIIERDTELKGYEVQQLDFLLKSYAVTVQMRRKMMESSIITNTLMIKNKRIQQEYEKAVHTSLTDELTKVNNKVALNTKIKDSIRTSPYVIVFFDIDNFKFINDTYGHDAGDQVLIWFAQRLKRICEELGGDIYRYGGDEFIAIFQGGDTLTDLIKSNMDTFIQIVRNKVFKFSTKVTTDAQPSIVNPGDENSIIEYNHSITTSIGIYYNNQALPFDEAKHIADDAMYQSKQNGKNTVTVVNL